MEYPEPHRLGREYDALRLAARQRHRCSPQLRGNLFASIERLFNRPYRYLYRLFGIYRIYNRFWGMSAPERKVSMPSRNSSMVIWSMQGAPASSWRRRARSSWVSSAWRAVGGAPLQGRMGYLSFRRFRLRAMGTDGFAVMCCVAVTGERVLQGVGGKL